MSLVAKYFLRTYYDIDLFPCMRCGSQDSVGCGEVCYYAFWLIWLQPSSHREPTKPDDLPDYGVDVKLN